LLDRRTEESAASVHAGVVDLRGGQRLKGYVLPVGGAIVGGVLGGVVGGPVGAVAGLKAGAITAATAGTAGALGGAFVGYRVRKSNDQAAQQEAGSPPATPSNHAVQNRQLLTSQHDKED
jgi:hypothetical protein